MEGVLAALGPAGNDRRNRRRRRADAALVFKGGNLMRYFSTRGLAEPVSFKDAVLSGLARDGGLLIPESIPDASGRMAEWAALSYPELAAEIFGLFADLPRAALDDLARRSCAAFRHPEVAPVVKAGNIRLLELFHGPTLAFKDLALQFLGRLFEYYLAEDRRELNLLAATSGDTGSAAIHGVRGRENIRIFVLFPRGRVSPVQERQMTTVPDANVHAIAVRGSFDDCQALVKTLFRDLEFRDAFRLGSVNSINWARIMAQIVYYFYAAFRVLEQTGAEGVRFTVPTGNFGDIFAGYMARKMGLPIRKLVLATNENDILSRFFRTGEYRRGAVHPTPSPSMDIQAASNFERYLYYRTGNSPERVRALMDAFDRTGSLSVPPTPGGAIDDAFAAGSCDTAGTLATIREFYERHERLLDPHTAVGVKVALENMSESEPMVCLATAHPAKFGAAIREATGRDLAHHEILDALAGLPARCSVLDGNADVLREFIRGRCRA